MPPKSFIALTVNELPSAYLNGFVKQALKTLSQEVLARPKLSEKERYWFLNEARTLRRNLKKILPNKMNQQKDIALRAVASALCLSFYHGGDRQILAKIWIQHTARATAGRQRTDIQAIISKKAKLLWQKNKRFATHHSGTAENIYAEVAVEIGSLQRVPKWWMPRSNEAPAETKKRRLEAIRKRVARIP